MEKLKRWEKLSSKTVIRTLFLCAANVIVICVLCYIYLNTHYKTMAEGVRIGFTMREVILCVLLAFLMDGVVLYKVIVKPLWEMEETVEKNRELLCGKDNMKKEDRTIEETLFQLIRQVELINAKEQVREKQRKKTELYALQSQINPHFLYNALDSIRGYALLHDMEEIADITEALSRVFRNMISNKKELLPLRQEIDNINNYMKIQQFRFNNKFLYSCEIPDEMYDKYMVPRMALQPLVENGIMHGLERKVGEGWIRLTAYETEKRFVLCVTDNGIGIEEDRLERLNDAMQMDLMDYEMNHSEEHEGIALININQRIKLSFGNQYGIVLRSTPNIRTSTELVLPLIHARR